MTNREWETLEYMRRLTWPLMTEQGVFAGEVNGNAKFDAWCCVAASRIGYDVLKEHYLKVQPVKLQVLTCNRVAWEFDGLGALADHGVAHAVNNGSFLPEGYFVSGCGMRPQEESEDGWLSGHVALIVEDEALLDLSAPQFSVLDQGVLVEPLLVTMTDGIMSDFRQGSWIGIPLEDCGGGLLYRQHPDQSGFFDAPDWKTLPGVDPGFRQTLSAQLREALAAA